MRECYSTRDKLKHFISAHPSRSCNKLGTSAPISQLITDILLRQDGALSGNDLSECYQLPDGNVVEFNSERFCAPELYFTPVFEILTESNNLRKTGFSRSERYWTVTVVFQCNSAVFW